MNASQRLQKSYEIDIFASKKYLGLATVVLLFLGMRSSFVAWMLCSLVFVGSLTTTTLIFLMKLILKPAKNVSTKKFSGKAIGHRGCAGVVVGDSAIPEQSLAAFQYASTHGADGIEFDVRLTADKVPVICHNDDINNILEGTGKISQMTFDDIAKLKFKNFEGSTPLENRLISLDEVFDFIERDNNDLLALVEIKEVKCALDAAEIVCQKIKERNMINNAAVISFHPLVPPMVRRAHPDIATGIVFERNGLQQNMELFPPYFKFIAPLIDPFLEFFLHYIAPFAFGVNIVVTPEFLLSKYLISYYQRGGLTVACWNVEEDVDFRWCLEYGVSPICDDLKRHNI